MKNDEFDETLKEIGSLPTCDHDPTEAILSVPVPVKRLDLLGDGGRKILKEIENKEIRARARMHFRFDPENS